MKNYLIILFVVAACLLEAGCQSSNTAAPPFAAQDLSRTDWREIENKARGTTVAFAMWTGDENRNRFFQSRVTEELAAKYGIKLQIVPLGDTAEAVGKLLNEKSAGKSSGGSIDMIWINGENFRSAKQGSLLWGAFAEKLPNLKYYDEVASKRDFGTAIDGLEAPWQKSQFVFAYDAARFKEPPRSIPELGEWIKANPGRFAYIAPPDFTGSAFLRHVLFHFGGGADKFREFDEQTYQDAAQKTFAFLSDIKPFLWRKGETYPNSPKELDGLFANREVDFSFAYGANFASDRIKRGEFPPTTQTFVLNEGTISNYSFLTIPFNASNPAGSLAVINYLMSPEFQIAQAKTLGTVYPHKLDNLSAEQRKAADELERGAATLGSAELDSRSVAEADSEYLVRLEKDWREKVLLK